MQVRTSYAGGRRATGAWRWLAVLGVMLAGMVGLRLWAAQPAPQGLLRPRQGQVAWQFLQAVLRADYVAAYGRLAPEVRQSVSLGHFEAAARPLWRSGQQQQPEIELYKLGVRLGEHGAARLFYTFAFAADSSRKPPPMLLEVTFRDTASRVVLGFALRTNKAPAKPVKPAVRVAK